MEDGWIALLRAVNLGPRNRVPMAELRLALAEEGLDDVRTYIASGNVLFRAARAERDELAARLEGLVAVRFGVRSPVALRTFAELRDVVAAHPFGADTSQTHVSFLVGDPSPEGGRKLAEADIGDDEAVVSGCEVYLRFRSGVQGARLSAARLERLLGVAGTVRNWRTVAKLAELTASR